ncbi:endonuclease/exonuclease/phosphatase family protein [Aeromicrobium sp. CF4.19]|uniref:endonuclease/exonuclease/phosphatase family protein n=1 Tax=Aeromicrobium sp. CF4.19 TaxID=3373082 RepID=UPI003EE77D78
MDVPEVRFAGARWVLAGVSCLGVVLFAVPGHLGLWDVYPFTQLSSMRTLTALGILVGALSCLVWAGVVRRGTWWRPSLATALVSLVCVGIVGTTAVGDGALRSEAMREDAADVTVMSFNAKDTRAVDIARAAEESYADAILLVEAPAEVVQEVADLLRDEATAFTNEDAATSSFDSVGVVVLNRLGRYEQSAGPTLQLGSVVIEGNGNGPTHLAAVHPPPPVQRWAPAAHWGEQLRTVVRWCEDNRDGIVGGDLNAISDHVRRSGLDRCESATDTLGLAGRGTWPVDLPAWLGAGIDHQLSDPTVWDPVAARIVEVGDSDHRAVLVGYRRG